MKAVIVGGGAAGFLAAVTAAERVPEARVVILEATDRPLEKVRVSGGGRCNVTHHCYDPAQLVKNYPRGHRELRGPLSRFGPRETIAWFAARGVPLKTEADGRMFPVTDESRTIIRCLSEAARDAGVQVRLNSGAKEIRFAATAGLPKFEVVLHNGAIERCERLLLATGSGPQGYRFAQALGHTIVPCVPSLFTFKVKDARLLDLSGVSFPDVVLTLHVNDSTEFHQRGPMLITHWGVSGPAVLKLSAWAARELHDSRYRARLEVNFAGGLTADAVRELLDKHRQAHGRRRVAGDSLFDLPHRYWERLMVAAGISTDTTWAHLTGQSEKALAVQLTEAMFEIGGKGIFKDEFVTCGGVSLRGIDFRTMESRVCPGLFVAGELLDIDGITGGFNFQSAWCTGWIAGQHLCAP